MTTADVLRQARALIADEARWCQDTYAMSASGVRCPARHDRAAQWCALGAILRVAGPEHGVTAATALLRRAADGVRVTYINDEVGHAAVLKLYDEAIRLAEEATRG